MQLTISRDIDSLQQAVGGLAMDGKRIALVPTMGALHAGHQALIRQGLDLADAVVVTIFVNPKQFGPNEDFAKYPRMLEEDIKKAGEAGATIVYAPDVEDLYPKDFATSISAGPLSTIMEGKARPGHFDGVATVVTKLLLRTLPHVALFGEKDYQQLCIIQRVVNDLDIGVDIAGVETVREPDGLALSSRNAYLSPEHRKTAPLIHKTLQSAAAELRKGAAVKPTLDKAVSELTNAGFKVDYFELRHEYTLAEMTDTSAPSRLLVAATLGTTRLIDNLPLE